MNDIHHYTHILHFILLTLLNYWVGETELEASPPKRQKRHHESAPAEIQLEEEDDDYDEYDEYDDEHQSIDIAETEGE